MSASPEKSSFRLEDQYRLLSLSAPALSPDGRRIAYIVEGYRKGENDRYQSLWIVPTDGSLQPHRLTRGPSSDRAPAWSPDGRYLAFLSTRPDEIEVAEAAAQASDEKEKGAKKEPAGEKEPKSQIWVLDVGWGGEPRQITRREEGVDAFSWSPDGEKMVFQSRDPSPQDKAYLESVRDEKGPFVIDRMQHKRDGHGYLDNVRSHLFTLDLPSRRETRLTSGPASEEEPSWSPTGDWILFTSNRTGDPDNNDRYDLWLIRPDGSESRRLTLGDVSAREARFSPDGQKVAFITTLEPENAYVLRHLAVVDVPGAKPVASLETLGDGWSRIGGIVPDQVTGDPVESARVYPVPLERTPMTLLTESLDRTVLANVRWRDGETVLALAADRGQTRLLEATLGGKAIFSAPLERSRTLADMDAGRQGTALVVTSPETGEELFFVGPGGGEDVLLTAHQAALLGTRATATYERISFPAQDGQEVEALVAFPPGFRPGSEKLPAIVSIHGGPMWYDSPQFRFDEQMFAAHGYLVLLVNYRGSIGYGEAFSKVIQGDWGPREHGDVMAGVDAVVRRGWADPDRLFVTGFSQGGIMTNWAVGHSDRFRAGVTEHGMWDYVAGFGTDDCHLWWQDDLGVPWQNEEAYRRISPMTGLASIRTPLLIMAGQEDWRCPLTQAEELYVALKKRGVSTELVIYQEEHHAITKPRRAIDRIRRILKWFEQFGGLPMDDASAEGYPDAPAALRGRGIPT